MEDLRKEVEILRERTRKLKNDREFDIFCEDDEEKTEEILPSYALDTLDADIFTHLLKNAKYWQCQVLSLLVKFAI